MIRSASSAIRSASPSEQAQHDELVAADAGDEVAFADIGLQHAGGMHQHGVAGRVAERVVDLLEAVEIDMQQRDTRPASAGTNRSSISSR